VSRLLMEKGWNIAFVSLRLLDLALNNPIVVYYLFFLVSDLVSNFLVRAIFFGWLVVFVYAFRIVCRPAEVFVKGTAKINR
jgi:hypothetical protein